MLVLNVQGHQFGFDSPGVLRYRDPEGKERTIPFREGGLRLWVSSLTGEIRVKGAGQSISLSPLSGEQLRDFLLELFRQWRNAAPDEAKKAAFDYAEAQRGFVPVAFGVTLLLSLPLSVALLADSHQQFSCTKELRQSAVPGTIERIKARKKDSRTYILHLQFNAPNGQVFEGKEQVMTKDASNLPTSFPIFYSPERPECWTLTQGLDSQEIPWAKRRYAGTFTLLFGLFFLGATVLGLGWSVARWLRPRPWAKEVKELFELKF